MINWLTRLLKTPKTQIGFLLTLIFITAFFNNPSLKAIFVFTLSIGSTLLFDLLFLKIRRVKSFFLSASLVTGSIIGLLTSPLANWYIPIAIGAFAMFSKNFIRFGNRHVFNPTAFGLLVGTLILATPVSWWAVSWQQFTTQNLEFIIYFLIFLSPAFVSMVKMKRYRITLSFLIVYALLAQFLNLNSSILNFIADPTTLFFATVMLPEPMTTPNNHVKQILFGIFVGLLAIFVSSPILNSKFLIIDSVDPLVLSLLLGNLVFYKLR